MNVAVDYAIDQFNILFVGGSTEYGGSINLFNVCVCVFTSGLQSSPQGQLVLGTLEALSVL